jgi:hypothetical protein
MKKEIVIIGGLGLVLVVGSIIMRTDDVQRDVGLESGSGCLAESILQDEFDHYAQTVIEAREISGTDVAPVNILDDWAIGDAYVLWSDSTGTMFVDEKLFSDVTVRNATGIGASEDALTITTTTQRLLSQVAPSEIVEALLRTQIIGLYAHLYGSACLVAEETVDGLYIATYEGQHSYCTNECIDEDFGFSVRVNTVTGEILLQTN